MHNMPQQRIYDFLSVIVICCIGTFIVFHVYGLPDIKVHFFSSENGVMNVTLLLKNHIKQPYSPKGEFLINTPSCKIRNLDPYDISIRSRLVKAKPPMKCDKFRSFTYQIENKVFINYTAVNSSDYNNTFQGCYVIPIIRPVDKYSNHNTKGFLPKSKLFTTFIKSEHEYVMVQCVNNSGAVINENFFSFVMKNESVESRCRTRMNQAKSRDTYSVMIIGLDSVSRLNSIRYLKKTRNFLFNEMQAIEMLGFNKVGDNTFENMVPLLTGKYPKELPWSSKKRTIFDNYNIIWKNYSEEGYRTLYLEDHPEGGTFDYLNYGFRLRPTDYYNRHFQLMMVDKLHLWYNDKNCFVDKSQTEIVMNFTYRFMNTFKKDPYFGLTFITKLTHDHLANTADADKIYHHYLRKIHENNLLENTILFFMSDHGVRFGAFRSEYIGKMEERLPMFHIVLPKRFRKKYPGIVKNLYDNSKKLTTHFDVYKTLLDILHLRDDQVMDIKPYSTESRAHSLFREIPDDRTCENASIDRHWCTCSQLQKVSLNNNFVIQSAKYVIGKINSLLNEHRNLCVPLRLEQIDEAYEFVTENSELNGRLTTMQVNVRATPGGAMFEGTVTYDRNTNNYTLSGDVSRINSFAKEKRCLVDRELEKLCYCRSNIT